MTEHLVGFAGLGFRWGKSAKTARRIAEDAALPMVRLGGSWRVRVSDIEVYEHAQQAESPNLKALVHAAVLKARARAKRGAS